MERDSFVDVAILCVCVCSFQMTNKYIICIYNVYAFGSSG